MTRRDDWIEAGAVVRPHGIRGEVVVELARDLLTLIGESMELRLTSRRDEATSLEVERAREHKGRLIIKFVGVDTRTAAEKLRSRVVWLTREQIGPLEKDRWFVQDIVGMDVYTDGDEFLGVVVDVMHMPANDVYVVKGSRGELLLPVIDEVITDVDVEGHRMTVHLMEGMGQGER